MEKVSFKIRFKKYFNLFCLIATISAIATNIINQSFPPFIHIFIPLFILTNMVINLLSSSSFTSFLRENVFEIIITIALLMTFQDPFFLFNLALAYAIAAALSYFKLEKIKTKSQNISLIKKVTFFFNSTPSRIVFYSFLILIIIGTFLLMLPVSSTSSSLGFANAFFLSASSVSTTGLSPISISQDLTLFGQIVVLILVQIGGIGIMTISSSIAMLIGKQFSVKDRLIIQDMLDANELDNFLQLVWNIIKITTIIEIWGIIALTYFFNLEGYEFTSALYHATFHSISTFCTAGFSTFDTSLEQFVTNHPVNITISILAILGGIGFVVMKECSDVLSKKIRISQLSVHSKITISATSIFLIAGTSIVFFNEYLYSLDRFSLIEKIEISFFQFMSTMTTAGFNTISIGDLQSSTLFFLILVMFVGGAPGSTAGGVKITTVVVAIFSIKEAFLTSGQTTLFKRKVPSETIIKSIAILTLSIFLILIFIYLIILLEPTQKFLVLAFEVLSSFGTVGLSAGVTSYLKDESQIVLGILMYIGRIGPLTLILALAQKEAKPSSVKIPEDYILVG